MTIPDVQVAAASLRGLDFPNGWKVVRLLPRPANGTGGTFSHRYVVEKDGKLGFLKAFDFSRAFEDGKDTIQILAALTSAYHHERTLLEQCKEAGLSRVVVAVDSGDLQVPGMPGMDGRVFYLIFEMADGDIRSQVDQTTRFDTLWSLRALKDACLGLWQVHRQMIAHQDIKPSNVLVYRTEEAFRVADFGRASQKGRDVWYNSSNIAGDQTYAPPELLYGYVDPDFSARRVGCDLYMLGNLAAFMFGGINVTASLFARLDTQFHWQAWAGTYEQVLPHVLEAFSRLLHDLEQTIDPLVCEDITPMIRDLCNPDLARRGHPRGIGSASQYSLERYVSTLPNAVKRLEIKQRVARAS